MVLNPNIFFFKSVKHFQMYDYFHKALQDVAVTVKTWPKLSPFLCPTAKLQRAYQWGD